MTNNSTEMRKCWMKLSSNYSQDKLFKTLEWILFIGLIIVSGWFASEVLEHFFSNKTSFSQQKEKITDFPVIFVSFRRSASEFNLSDVKIRYYATGIADWPYLEIGKNDLYNDRYDKNESVIFESIENQWNSKSFRIIHASPILEKNMAKVEIQIEHNVEHKTSYKFSDLVYFYITSQENSPGGSFYDFKDGKPLQVTMDKNNIVGYNIQPQMTKYLRETGECQEEPYYKCIASQLDLIEINECSNKCIPKIFSNLGKNYSTPFCQNDNDNERCIIKKYHEQVIEEHQDFTTSCKKSCTNLEYFGEVTLNMPTSSEKSGNWHMYNLRYKLTNPNFELMVHEEYFIYDAIGMIGSVGGTLGTH